jgi:hypothetical protein
VTETQFRRQVVNALRSVGFMVSVIEPNLGSTPGIPDLVLSKDDLDRWVELKVTDKTPTTRQVWEDLLRPVQRRWIRDRVMVADVRVVPVYVLVRVPTGILLYSTAHKTEKGLGIGLVTQGTLDKAINQLKARWY